MISILIHWVNQTIISYVNCSWCRVCYDTYSTEDPRQRPKGLLEIQVLLSMKQRWSSFVLLPQKAPPRFLFTPFCLSPICPRRLISPPRIRSDKLGFWEQRALIPSLSLTVLKFHAGIKLAAASTHHLNVHNVPPINNVIFNFNSIHLVVIRW